MQVFGLPGHVIRSAGAASRLVAAKIPNIEAERRRDAVVRWQAARQRPEQPASSPGYRRCALDALALAQRSGAQEPAPASHAQTGLPPGQASAVERPRLDHPMRGKRKLAPVLRTQGFTVSKAMAGRILGALIERGIVAKARGLIRKAAARKAPKKRPRRHLRKARRHRPDRHAPGRHRPRNRHQSLRCGDPFAKWTAARPYRRATSRNAAGFLNKVLAGMPDSVKAIKTGGGPVFMAGFERACAGRNLPLYVLPPHSPKLNAGAERCNGARRYEFYACVEIPGEIKKIAGLVNGFQHLYNYHRPHGALAGATPAQHLKIRRANKAPLAHIS